MHADCGFAHNIEIVSLFFCLKIFRSLKMKRDCLRSEPTKSHNLFDSEAEREDSIKDSILKNNTAWLFEKDKLILVTYRSTKWPKNVKPSEMLSLIEGESYNLQDKDQPVSCRLLCKGNLKKVEEEMKIFQAELDHGKNPSDLRKKVLAASKAPVVDDVNFLSRSRAPVMRSREVCIGQSTERKKSKNPTVETLTQPAVLQGS